MKITNANFLSTSSPTVRSRVDIEFEWFTLKGFKILFNQKTNSEFLAPPSYLANGGWRPLFKADKETWKKIEEIILKMFNEKQAEETMSSIKS